MVAGTTGEASTLTDEEQLGLIELAVAERPAGKSIIAGTGTNDTAPGGAPDRTRDRTGGRRGAVGDALLQPPQPARAAAPLRSGRGGDRQTDDPLQHPRADRHQHAARPARGAGRRSRASRPSSRPTPRSCSRSTASTCTPATMARSRGRSTWAAPAGSWWPATSSATRCAGWSTSPRSAPTSTLAAGRLQGALHHLQPDLHEGGTEHARPRSRGLRLPLVEATAEESAEMRAMLERHGLLGGAPA